MLSLKSYFLQITSNCYMLKLSLYQNTKKLLINPIQLPSNATCTSNTLFIAYLPLIWHLPKQSQYFFILTFSSFLLLNSVYKFCCPLKKKKNVSFATLLQNLTCIIKIFCLNLISGAYKTATMDLHMKGILNEGMCDLLMMQGRK